MFVLLSAILGTSATNSGGCLVCMMYYDGAIFTIQPPIPHLDLLPNPSPLLPGGSTQNEAHETRMAPSLSLGREGTADDLSGDAEVGGTELATVIPLAQYNAIRLYAPGVNTPAGVLGDSEVTMGRSEELKDGHKFNNVKLSSRHCKVFATDTTIFITDTSKNGTFVNGSNIATNPAKTQQLMDGDTVSLLNPSKYVGVKNVEFLIKYSRPAGKRKRDGSEESPAKKIKSADGSVMAQTLTCSICQEFFYKPLACLPCLHNFCTPCMSSWIQHTAGSSDPPTPLECSLCRTNTTEIRKNHSLQSSVEAFFEENPALQPTPLQVIDFEAKITIDPLSFVLPPSSPPGSPPGSPGSPFSPNSGSDDDSDSSAGPSSPPPAASPISQCDCVNGRRRLDWYNFAVLPGRAFAGSQVERRIFMTFLNSQGRSVATVWEDCKAKLLDWNWREGLIREQAPPLVGDVFLSTEVCQDCAARVFSGLLYHFRRDIPTAQLTASAGHRPDCWYGMECRTQFNRVC